MAVAAMSQASRGDINLQGFPRCKHPITLAAILLHLTPSVSPQVVSA